MLFVCSIPTTLVVFTAMAAQVHAMTIPAHDVSLFEALLSDGPTAAYACPEKQGCDMCVEDKDCGFSKSTFQCEPRSKAKDDQVLVKAGCGQIKQMQTVFPPVDRAAKAGIIPADIEAQWQKIRKHVLFGEADNVKSGRHTSKAWTTDNPKSKWLGRNKYTNIASYEDGVIGKTVWESDSYTELDIKNMCAVSIKLRNNIGPEKTEAAFVVQSPYGTPACINSNTFNVGSGSCFPLGINLPIHDLGEQCTGKEGELPNDHDQQKLLEGLREWMTTALMRALVRLAFGGDF